MNRTVTDLWLAMLRITTTIREHGVCGIEDYFDSLSDGRRAPSASFAP